MHRLFRTETLFTLVFLALAGVAPNLFPVAQAGYAKLSVLGLTLLLPSVVLLALTARVAWRHGHQALVRRVAVGAAAGAIATLGLEAVRMVGFRLGGMPGDMPRLLGVLLTDRFMVGPSLVSDVLGYAYHFWNGAAFGIVFVVLFGRRGPAWGVAFGLLVGLGFLASPAVKPMGVGAFASGMPAMQVTVGLAHLVYGFLLGLFTRRCLRSETCELTGAGADTVRTPVRERIAASVRRIPFRP